MQCSSCQLEVGDAAKFCTECGAKLARECSDCAREVPPDAKFCPGCGARVATADRRSSRAENHRVPSAEWRQLTVMFCDLVGSTLLSSRLDPEDFREVVRAYQETCAEVIRRFDGHIAQYLGDGLLIYFGYPQASERGPHRAVRTGLGIVAALAELNERLVRDRGTRLAVRIGIHTGLVVVGEVGGGDRHERLALGPAPNVAARIQSLAEPDAVLISGTTHSLVRGDFSCRDVGVYALKGVEAPLPLFQVLGESDVRSRLDTAAAAAASMVGRQKELELLLRLWDRAREGRGQVVLLSGEAGIGKSHLARVLKRGVASERSMTFEYQCSPYYRQSALHPVIDHLQRLFDPADSPADKLIKLERTFEPYNLPPERVVPLVAGLLSLPLPEGRYPPLNMSPQRQRQMTQQVVVDCFLDASERRALLLIWEDLQWADPTTLELLKLLIVQAPTARLLLLLTFRSDFRPPWAVRSHQNHLTLGRLTRPQAEELTAMVSGGRALAAEVLEQLVKRADGVPLFVEELAKMVLDSAPTAESGESSELAGRLPPLAIPATLQDSLMARLDRFPTMREIAQLASALGREFAYGWLRAVSSMDEAALQEGLAQLVDAELFYQRGVPPGSRYTFKHTLIQEAAYRSLLRRTRKRYHEKIARALEEGFPEIAAAQPELLAYQFTEADLIEQAVDYWHRAGVKAARQSAYAEATSHLTRGLELLARLPEGAPRNHRELLLKMSLGESMIFLRGPAATQVEQVFFRAWQLCQEAGDDPHLFQALYGLFRFYVTRAEAGAARDLGQQLLRLAERQRNPEFFHAAHLSLGLIATVSGDPAAAVRHHDQATGFYSSRVDPSDPAAPQVQVSNLSFSALALWLLGHPDQARKRCLEAHSLAQERSHPGSIVEALSYAAMICQCRREPRATREWAEAAAKLAHEQGFPHYAAMSVVLLGWVDVQEGRAGKGIDEMRRGLTSWRASGFRGLMTYILVLLAGACGQVGEQGEGLAAVAEGLDLAHETGERTWDAELLRLRGELLARSEVPVARVEACFQQALDVARCQGAKSLELRAARNLAGLWRDLDRIGDARSLLEGITRQLGESSGTVDLREAKTLLEELRR